MDFGTLIFTKPERAMRDVPYAEERGFTHAWIPDSHMIWGDTYACMALAAVNSKKIKLGTGIAVASNRIPPVTVQAIATINQLAPGRTLLGFGTGHTGRRVMGLPPVGHAEFREQVRVIHDLLKGGEADYRAEDQEHRIRFLHRDLRFINLDDPIPFYVAANGPKTLALAADLFAERQRPRGLGGGPAGAWGGRGGHGGIRLGCSGPAAWTGSPSPSRETRLRHARSAGSSPHSRRLDPVRSACEVTAAPDHALPRPSQTGSGIGLTHYLDRRVLCARPGWREGE